jgi:transcriptional regulator with XRE-family HTH domain
MKSKREARGLSLRDASKLTGISHVHIRDIERDNFRPTFEKVIALLRAYHVDIQEFLLERVSLFPF